MTVNLSKVVYQVMWNRIASAAKEHPTAMSISVPRGPMMKLAKVLHLVIWKCSLTLMQEQIPTSFKGVAQ